LLDHIAMLRNHYGPPSATYGPVGGKTSDLL
jgi:hypothetical protein